LTLLQIMTNNVAAHLDTVDSNTTANDETDFISSETGRAVASSSADAKLLLPPQQQPAVKASGSQTSQDQLQGCIL